MIYNIGKASDNMLKSQSELAEMVRKQNEKIIKADEEKALREQAALNREASERSAVIESMYTSRRDKEVNRAQYLENVKSSFLSECMYKLYTESSVGVLTKNDKIVAKNLVNKFIRENGIDSLLINFRHKNQLLSEFARITDKYYDKVLEFVDDDDHKDAVEVNFDQTIADDFYKDLEDVDMDTASEMIRSRVSDAINQFIDDNAAAKIEYKDILQSAQDKADTVATSESATKTQQAIAEEQLNRAKGKVKEMKQNRDRNIFHCVVESLTKSTMTDESLKQRFVHEGQIDMDSVVDNAALIYTMLEMVNTTSMVNVNEEYIEDYLANLGK